MKATMNKVETEITEAKVLEFTTAVMKEKVYRQVREVTESAGVEFIGYTLTEGDFLTFIGKLGNVLVKIKNVNMDGHIVEVYGWDVIGQTAEQHNAGKACAITYLIDEVRDALPQIYVI